MVIDDIGFITGTAQYELQNRGIKVVYKDGKYEDVIFPAYISTFPMLTEEGHPATCIVFRDLVFLTGKIRLVNGTMYHELVGKNYIKLADRVKRVHIW